MKWPDPIPRFGFPGEHYEGTTYIVPPQPELGTNGVRVWIRHPMNGPRYGIGPEPRWGFIYIRFAEDLIEVLALIYHFTGHSPPDTEPCNTRSPNLIPSAPSSAQIENPLPTK